MPHAARDLKTEEPRARAATLWRGSSARRDNACLEERIDAYRKHKKSIGFHDQCKITVRGQARTQGRVVACDVMRRVDGWFVSIVIECEPTRKGGERVCGMDWGVETFLTLAYGENDFDSVENDRLYQQHKVKISQKQRELARGKRGSKTSQKRRKALAKLHRNVPIRLEQGMAKSRLSWLVHAS